MIIRCPTCGHLVAVKEEVNGECPACGDLYTWYDNGSMVWGLDVDKEPQENDLIEYILLILSGFLFISYFAYFY